MSKAQTAANNLGKLRGNGGGWKAEGEYFAATMNSPQVTGADWPATFDENGKMIEGPRASIKLKPHQRCPGTRGTYKSGANNGKIEKKIPQYMKRYGY